MKRFIKKAEENFIFLYSFMYITLTALLVVMCIGLIINYKVELKIEKKQDNIMNRIEIVKEKQLDLSYSSTQIFSSYIALLYSDDSNIFFDKK